MTQCPECGAPLDRNARFCSEYGAVAIVTYLFHAWDSGFYVSIARNGYYHPAYVFLPAYPSLIAFLGWIARDYWTAAFLISLLFSLGSLVIFQRIAESYMDKKEAGFATLLFAAFPQVALFTTLAYSEGVFLFASLSAWYLYRKGKMLAASMFAALAALKHSLTWQEALRNAERLVAKFCEQYNVPPARIIVNPSWLAGLQARGAYFPDFHMMVLQKFQIETPFDCLIVLHEFFHHCAHGVQHL